MLLKLNRLNHPVRVFLLLALTIASGFLAFLIFLSSPHSPGKRPVNYVLRELYYFEPWHFKLEEMELSLPRGGMLAPAYRGQSIEGIAVIAPSFIFIQEEKAGTYRQADSFFLTMSMQELDKVKGKNIFLPVEEAAARSEMVSFLQKMPGLPAVATPGLPRLFLPAKDAGYAYMLSENGSESSHYFYYRYQGLDLARTAAFYLLLSITALLIVQMLSLDLDHPRSTKSFLQEKPSQKELIFVFLLLPPVFWLETKLSLTEAVPFITTSLYLLPAALAFCFSQRHLLVIGDLGCSRQNLLRSLSVAAVIIVVFLFMTEWATPRGLASEASLPSLLAAFLTGFFLPSLAREIYWRGLLQTTLERSLGLWWAILATALLAGFSALLTRYFCHAHFLSFPYLWLEFFLLVPLKAVILGFFYSRTRNAWGGAFLQAMLLFLPLYLRF